MATMQELCSFIDRSDEGEISATTGNTTWTYRMDYSEADNCLKFELIKQFKGRVTMHLYNFGECGTAYLHVISRDYRRKCKASAVPMLLSSAY